MQVFKIFLLALLFILFALFVLFNLKTQAYNDSKVNICEVLSSNKKNFHGFVKAQYSSNLSFQSEGKIVFMPYSKGDYVKKGQVLSRLDGILYKIRKKEENARLNEVLIQYNKAKNYYSRMEVLHKAGAISDNDWEEAYYQLKTSKEEIEIQKEKINYLNKEISYNILLAPYDGYVSHKYSQIGENVKIGQPVLNIMGSDVTRVEAMASANDINYIQLNDIAIVERDGRIYKGKIAHISKSSVDVGGYLIKIDLDKIYPELKDGMDVNIIMNLNNLISIPVNSVFDEGSYRFVYKVLDRNLKKQKIEKQKITTGRIIDGNIEVFAGLNQNDSFVCGNFDKINLKKKRINNENE